MSDNRKAVLPKPCDSLLITLPVSVETILICQNFVGLWNFLNNKKIKILKVSRILRLYSCNLPLSKSNTLKYLVEQMFTLLRVPREKKTVYCSVRVSQFRSSLLSSWCHSGSSQLLVTKGRNFFLGSKLERVGKFDYFFLRPFPKFNHWGKSRFLIYNVLCAWFLTLPQEYMCRWPQWNSKFLGFSISAVPQPSA